MDRRKRAIRVVMGLALVGVMAVVAVSLLTAGAGGARAVDAGVGAGERGAGYGNQVAGAATATHTAVAGAARVGIAEVVERIAALERQVGALTGRISALESARAAATATPAGQACVEAIRAGAAVSGSWAAGCVTSHPPASNPGGVYYARFYTFTLAAAGDVNITLSSEDAAPHLLVLRGAGRGGAIVQEASPVSVDPATDEITITDTIAITASLAAGSYTIESSTYYAGKTGDFRVRLDVGD